ncbi:Abi family protein [Vibrio cholerae]|uniref:Abi family protein n=1 Tax=Vibrio cholerae TaxID=666 RepID=UPI0002C173B4|nr:Abi family protein [Vibrio cholerae]EGR4198234.1 hypothetical protein [Vibrio cholerae]EJB8347819.1 Abi family protein [Vibrio cholerae]EJB8377282.1 Abi family protein [Vibrio cholerae]ELN3180642.1 Abi family protein [Vibrio cholerae]EMQ65013.1 hypothetical protein VCNHCC008D_002812 [Vibrio cholerae O1 str. NHCC-008D]
MAESQQAYPYNEVIEDTHKTRAEHIEIDLSSERLLPYFNDGKQDWYIAFNLYLYNARLSKAFLYPLHILEVTLRNKLHELFCSVFNDNWPNDPTFMAMLNQHSSNSLSKARQKVNNRSPEDIVAALSFDFWSNILFRSDYTEFWRTNYSKLNIDRPKFKQFKTRINEANDLRNRIAHHEPILRLNCSNLHTEILTAIQWCSFETYRWTKEHTTVPVVLRTKPAPTGNPQPLLGIKADNDFAIVQSTLTLDSMPEKAFIICEDKEIIITISDIGRYLLSKKDKNDLMIALQEHTLEMVIKSNQLSKNFIVCSQNESYVHTKKIFSKKRNGFIVVKDLNMDTLGVIQQPHRQL